MSTSNESENKYPKELKNIKLEYAYIGLLLENPKSISKYYLSFEDSQFSDPMAMNLYKSILFTEGGRFAPENIKRDFSYPKTSEEIYNLKQKLKAEAAQNNYSIEAVFTKIKKLFLLKKYYIKAPTQKNQEEILEIKSYKRYKQMTIEELENIISQIGVKRGISEGRLNVGVTDFLLEGDNSLTSGISLPFEILTEVFKGLRVGETMAFAMPSNSGKSRFTINLAAHIAFVEKKKVLIILLILLGLIAIFVFLNINKKDEVLSNNTENIEENEEIINKEIINEEVNNEEKNTQVNKLNSEEEIKKAYEESIGLFDEKKYDESIEKLQRCIRKRKRKYNRCW